MSIYINCWKIQFKFNSSGCFNDHLNWIELEEKKIFFFNFLIIIINDRLSCVGVVVGCCLVVCLICYWRHAYMCVIYMTTLVRKKKKFFVTTTVNQPTNQRNQWNQPTSQPLLLSLFSWKSNEWFNPMWDTEIQGKRYEIVYGTQTHTHTETDDKIFFLCHHSMKSATTTVMKEKKFSLHLNIGCKTRK